MSVVEAMLKKRRCITMRMRCLRQGLRPTHKFDYAFQSDPKDTLQLIVRNVTQRKDTFDTKLVPTPGKNVTEDITKAFAQPGKYILKYRLVKPGATDNDAAGFNNVTLTIVTK